MSYIISFFTSKFTRWLAIAGAVLAGLAVYGAKRKQDGVASVHDEIATQKQQVQDAIDKINNQPISDSIGVWVRKAKTDHHL